MGRVFLQHDNKCQDGTHYNANYTRSIYSIDCIVNLVEL